MNRLFYLSSCSTCKRLMTEWELPAEIILRDIKIEPVSASQLENLKSLAGSYEALFSKRAQLYKSRDLKSKNLTETDYKNLLLEHYSFLKRPVLVLSNQIFIGNSNKNVEAAKVALATV